MDQNISKNSIPDQEMENKYQKLKKTIDSGNDLILIINKSFKIIWNNLKAREYFGKDITGKEYHSILYGKNEIYDPCPIKQCFKDGKRQEFEIELSRSDNAKRIHGCLIGPDETDKNGSVKAVTGYFHDISLRKNFENQYKETNRLLKKTLMEMKEIQTQMVQTEKMASIGQLTAGVAHEIKNPTAFVRSNLTTLDDYLKDMIMLFSHYSTLIDQLHTKKIQTTLPDKIHEKMNQIKSIQSDIDIEFIQGDIPELMKETREGINRINKIISNLKDFTSPGDGEFRYVDINDVIENTLKVIGDQLKYHASVEKKYSNLPMIRCCSYRINQVFMNLLVNAAQAMEEKGQINIQTRINGRHVEISIKDTGRGIPQENLPKIFDPFFSTKDDNQGTGMGLHMSHRIVKEHKGIIKVESIEGEGAEFKVLLPIT